MDNQHSEQKQWIKSYVLRAARISNLQRSSYEKLRPLYSIPFTKDKISLSEVFPFCDRYVAEIGFGMGESTVQLAEKSPRTGFLGIEVHKPGVGKVLSEIHLRHLDNLRVINHDAVEVFNDMLPENSLDGIHIFFPDPWPKKRHHKRRLIQPAFMQLIRPALKREGYLYICTDWEEYAEQILAVCEAASGYKNSYDGFAKPQLWRPVTKFEQKGLARNHRIREILFHKTT